MPTDEDALHKPDAETGGSGDADARGGRLAEAFARVSAKKLVVALLLFALCLGWFQDVCRQLVLVAQLRSAGLEPTFRQGNVVEVSFPRSRTAFSDDDMERLKGFGHLEVLDLSYTQVTDAGLDCVKDFPRLQRLRVLVSQISKRRERELRDARPRLIIEKWEIIGGRGVVDGWQGPRPVDIE